MGGQGLAAPKTCAKVPKLNPFGTILGPREPGVQISGKNRELEGLRTMRKTLKRNLRALFQQRIRVEFYCEIRTPKTLRRIYRALSLGEGV